MTRGHYQNYQKRCIERSGQSRPFVEPHIGLEVFKTGRDHFHHGRIFQFGPMGEFGSDCRPQGHARIDSRCDSQRCDSTLSAESLVLPEGISLCTSQLRRNESVRTSSRLVAYLPHHRANVRKRASSAQRISYDKDRKMRTSRLYVSGRKRQDSLQRSLCRPEEECGDDLPMQTCGM